MDSRALTTALLAAPALLALQPRADEVSFRPADGSSLAKDYSIDVTISLGDITAFVDGQDMSEGIPADFELLAEMAMTVTDEYVETVDGRPRDLIRTYDSMEMYWEAADESGEAEEFAALEGKSVRFKWNDEDESYDVTFHESDGDEDLLSGLGVDMDLRALLPEGEVSEGDTWTVDASGLGSVFLFGGDMSDMDLGDGGGAEFAELFESELLPQIEAMLEEFSAECEYSGAGAIAITMDGEGTLDLTTLIEEAIATEVPDGFEVDVSVDEATVSLSIEGEGTLQWDLAAGHMRSFEMTSDFEVLVDVYVSADLAGESHELEASIELLGDGTWEAGLAEE